MQLTLHTFVKLQDKFPTVLTCCDMAGRDHESQRALTSGDVLDAHNSCIGNTRVFTKHFFYFSRINLEALYVAVSNQIAMRNFSYADRTNIHFDHIFQPINHKQVFVTHRSQPEKSNVASG